MDHVKLFIPGPVEVSPATFQAFCKPMIGHRSADFKNLYAAIQPRLREIFATRQPVYLSTSSAWGVMEAALRNLVRKRVLICMKGAFSDKWHDVALRCGFEATKCQVEWGKPITPDLLRASLAGGGFDAVTLIHNETSTGAMSPLADLADVMRGFPDTLFIVDSVSSFSVVPIEFDAWGIDVLLTGSQKALALPPGLALFALSERALERAKSVPNRGYYFDFLEFAKNGAENMTPSTPSIAHIHALEQKLGEIFAEGIAARHARHRATSDLVRAWARDRGFGLFPEPGFESRALTCVRNTRNLDVAAWIKRLRDRHRMAFDGGYGKIKGQTFRISNMGDETVETLKPLLAALDDTMPG